MVFLKLNFDEDEEYLYVTGFDDVSRIKLKK